MSSNYKGGAWHRLLRIGCVALVFGISGCGMVKAASEDRPIADAKVQAFISQMQTRHGLARARLEALFGQARFTQKVLDAFKRPAESKAWYQYRKIFLTDQRITAGAEFMREHAPVLARAEVEYGVPPEVIAAIIGVETFYGKYKGRIRVLDALTTLAFRYPRRAKFFRGELEAFLLLENEESLPATDLMGSYAGAVGFPQFIPTSYRAYAVDFDGDGRRDLIGSLSDAIGSVANYLHRHRWQAGAPIAIEVTGVRADDPRLAKRSLKPKLTTAGLAADGIRPLAGTLPTGKVTLYALRRETSPSYWVGYRNFYAISRYNPSKLYATAVFQLADAIRTAHAVHRADG